MTSATPSPPSAAAICAKTKTASDSRLNSTLLTGNFVCVSINTLPFKAGDRGTGIVEEAVFRGFIMTALERRWNRWVAVLRQDRIEHSGDGVARQGQVGDQRDPFASQCRRYLVGIVGGLFCALCWFIGIINAIQGVEKEVPLLGQIKIL